MKLNERGIVVESVLIYAIVGMILLFVPNPVSSAVGVGIRPNKTVQTDETIQTLVPATADGETLYHKDGSVALIQQRVYKRKDLDQEQHVTLWQSIVALPRLILLFTILGFMGIPGFAWVKTIYSDLKRKHETQMKDTKKIVKAIDEAFATIPLTLAAEKFPGEVDRAALSKKITDAMLNKLAMNYDQSTKDLVKAMRA